MGGAGVTVTATTVERRRVLGEMNTGREERGEEGMERERERDTERKRENSTSGTNRRRG